MKLPNYEKFSNERLLKLQKTLYKSLNHLDDDDKEVLNSLLELERELTLRENQ